MIHESAPWKNHLLKDADLLDRWAAKTSVSERRSFIIEQKVFLAAYAMRKLIEGRKLSSSFEDRSLRCNVFANTSDRLVTPRNNHRFHEFYDLSRPVSTAINIPVLIDTVIHSLVFCESYRDDFTLESFFVTSDKRRSKLWLIKLADFTKTMRKAGHDYPPSSLGIANQTTGEWQEWRGNGQAPSHFRRKIGNKK